MKFLKTLTPKNLISKLISFILISIFITIYGLLFGNSNILMGVCIITGILMLCHINLGFKVLQVCIVIPILLASCGIVASISLMNTYLGILINFSFIFILMTLVSQNLASKSFMPFILCYIFVQGNPVYGSSLWLRIMGLFLGGIVISVFYYVYHRKTTNKRNIADLFHEIDFTSSRTQFILRMSIGITLAMFIGSLFTLQKGMWISITVMSATQPFLVETTTRIKQRFFGSLLGALAYVLLFELLIPDAYTTYAVLLLSFTYTLINVYWIQMIFITINSLNAALIIFDTSISVPMRLSFICLGLFIVFIIQILSKNQLCANFLEHLPCGKRRCYVHH